MKKVIIFKQAAVNFNYNRLKDIKNTLKYDKIIMDMADPY